MTVTLRHPHTDNHHNAFRNIVVAVHHHHGGRVSQSDTATNTQTTATTTVADRTRPAIVDVTYDADQTRRAIIGLGAALSVTYDADQTRPASSTPPGLGAALSVTSTCRRLTLTRRATLDRVAAIPPAPPRGTPAPSPQA